MRRIAFDARFVNETGDDLIPGKIHTIRRNYDFWKRFEGQEMALFTWEGKPYRSKQKVFCVKRLVFVQDLYKDDGAFMSEAPFGTHQILEPDELAKQDGFKTADELWAWFKDCPDLEDMAMLHFTDFRY